MFRIVFLSGSLPLTTFYFSNSSGRRDPVDIHYCAFVRVVDPEKLQFRPFIRVTAPDNFLFQQFVRAEETLSMFIITPLSGSHSLHPPFTHPGHLFLCQGTNALLWGKENRIIPDHRSQAGSAHTDRQKTVIFPQAGLHPQAGLRPQAGIHPQVSPQQKRPPPTNKGRVNF